MRNSFFFFFFCGIKVLETKKNTFIEFAFDEEGVVSNDIYIYLEAQQDPLLVIFSKVNFKI